MFAQLGKWLRLKLSMRSSALSRLRSDFQLAIVVCFALVSGAMIVPFAIYRSFEGNYPVAALDWSLVLVIWSCAAYAWQTGKVGRAGTVLAFINFLGALISAELLGVVGLFWMYAAILSNFFLAPRTVAAVLTGTTLTIITWHGAGATAAQLSSFVASSLLVGVLAYVLANRIDAQRARLETLATRDPLTGAFNRRSMTEELAIAEQSRIRQNNGHSLLILDIDHFKAVNDRFGHAQGDRILSELATLIHEHTRALDRFFRYGGEEFVLLLPGLSEQEAVKTAEKIRVLIADRLQCGGEQITVSIGVATLRPEEAWPSWLNRADHALYTAKASGRNQVTLAG